MDICTVQSVHGPMHALVATVAATTPGDCEQWHRNDTQVLIKCK
jgi:hypothetical protein